MKKAIAMVLVVCLLGITAFGNLTGSIVKANTDSQQTDTELKEISFDDFGIVDQDITEWTRGFASDSAFTWENVIFSGKFTFRGGDTRYMLFGNGWYGLRFDFTTDNIDIYYSEGYGGAWSINATDVNMASFQDTEFKLSISLKKENTADARLTVYINNVPVSLGGEASQLLANAYAEDGHLNVNYESSNRVEFESASVTCPISVASCKMSTSVSELKEITFSDFNIGNGKITEWTRGFAVDPEFTWENVIFNGNLTFEGNKTRYLLMGNDWNGLRFDFNADTISIIYEGGAGGEWYVSPTDVEMETFQDTLVKLSVSLERINTADARLSVSINNHAVLLDEAESQVLANAYEETGNLNVNNNSSNRIDFEEADEEHPIIVSSIVPASTDLKTITFQSFGLDDGKITTGSVNSAIASDFTWEDVIFSGNLKFEGDATRYLLLGNGWNGLRFDFYPDLISVIYEGGAGGAWYVSPEDAGMTTFKDVDFKFSVSLEKVEDTEDACVQVYIGDTKVLLEGEESQTLAGAYSTTGNMNAAYNLLELSDADETNPIYITSVEIEDEGGNEGGNEGGGEDDAPIQKPELTKVTLKKTGIIDERYTYNNNDLAITGDYGKSLINTSMTQKMIFSKHTNNWFHYAAKDEAWYGIRFITNADTGKIDIIPTNGEFPESYELSPEIAGTELLGKEIELTLELFSEGEDAWLGVYINGNLYNNKYFKLTGAADKFGGLISIYSEDEAGYIQIGEKQEVPTINESFSRITFNSYELETGTYKIKYSVDDQGNPQPDASASGECGLESMDRVIFSDIVNFSKEPGAELRLFGKESPWHGMIWENTEDGIYVTDPYGVFDPIMFDSKTAGVELMGQDIHLTISIEYVDSDDDGNKDDVKMGVWFNGKPYANRWIYLRDTAPKLGGYALIFCKNENTSFSLQTEWPPIDFAEYGFTSNWAVELGLKKKS